MVLPASGTTSQPGGVTRVVNLSGTTPRVGVVSVAGTSSTGTATPAALTSPGRQNPKLVLTTSPKLVRTSAGSMLLTPASQASTSSAAASSSSSVPSTSVESPPTKKSRLSTEDAGHPTCYESPTEGTDYRRLITEHKLKRMRAIREHYYEDVAELFFLNNGGNMMDFNTWRKRPPTAQYLNFLKQKRLEADGEEEELLSQSVSETTAVDATATAATTVAATVVASATMVTATATTATTLTSTAVTTTAITTVATATVALTTATAITTTTAAATTTTTTTRTTAGVTKSATPVIASTPPSTEVTVTGGTPVAVSTTLPPAVAQLNQQGGTPIVVESLKTNSTQSSNPVIEKIPTANRVEKPATPPLLNPTQPIVKLVKLPASSIASACDSVSNQEQIVEKAKQEAYVMQRIAELQRDGLWSERRLPKIQEPPRPKAHWDYLLEEMVWLSTDFAQERKWKKSAAKKCARMVQKYFQEKALQAQKAEKLEELRLKKIAGFIAKEVKTFWTNVEKLVEYKQQTRLEEKRKKALDQHLNFIVDQTEKYSSWLTEGLNKPEGNQSTPASIHSSRISSPITTGKHSDDDFKPNQCSDDDEETIAKAEEEMKSNHKEEVELLKKESELPLEDLLKELPPNYLEQRDKSLSPLPRDEEENDAVEEKDSEFRVASDESSDDEEETIQEQEKLEKNVDHKQELDDLKAENEMSISELIAKYGNASETPMEVDETDDDESDKDEEENESDSENESESEDETEDDSQAQSDEEAAVGLKSLLEDLSDENKSISESSEKQNEMDSVAALAESIQPKGNTLLTTSVVTKIPFLLKHSLREYQHIGLDWLVTMFERKLNGILADEMGLGKTIQTIAVLAHLACEKGNWGPHLIIVPTSVMLNWEMECKKWCPGFKILTYYGTQKERKQKRTGWTKPNAFHICITSYKLVIQDHQSFRRKKWKYLILDEAQNIKNFKSQRWQLLLNFQTQRRLLLTGTPLQNNLMELWSLMHFLMPNVFQSHREFKEWFSNPVTGMIEGNNEYNENIIRRLHKVLRPFLLRRLKCEVEKQLPKKYEHVVMCRLSKRQRYLYDDFMSRAKTKETLASGNLLSVINVLMQLRKVCNHPNLFEVRPTVSPFQMEGINYHTASMAWSALDYDPFKHIELSCLNLHLVDLEFMVTAFVAHRMKRLKPPRKLIEEIDSQPECPPRCPSGKIKINVRLSNQVSKATTATQQSPQQIKIKSFPGILPTPRVGTSPLIKNINNQTPTGQGVTLKVAGGQQLQGFSVQLVPHQGGVKAIPVGTVAQNIQSTATVTPTTTGINAQRITIGNSNIKDGPQRLTTHTYTVKHGDSVQKYQVPSFAQLVQTSTGRHIILTNPNQQTTNALSFPVMTSSGQRLTVLSKQIMGLSTTPVSVNKVVGGVVTTPAGGVSTRPVMRVPPLNVSTSQTAGQIHPQTQIRCGIPTRNTQKDLEKNQPKEMPKSEFYLPELEETRRERRQTKLTILADINERRCAACPLYGEDLFTALRIEKPSTASQWHGGWIHCASTKNTMRTRKQFFSHTEALAAAIKSTEQIVEELKEIFHKFVVYVPAVQALSPRMHVSHPPPHKLWKYQSLQIELQRELSPKLALFHDIQSSMLTQFPEPRLIQYDCGKLQSLDLLLRELKVDDHRVLIFTQMTRMLDVLEAFLNYHGYIYLRLDGATKVDQRQVLMERFNSDKRIFCFILSTRSGGIGVNLTGADTVVFYDSDWNPTMDAQAQDRCHRIGQTRDVHIYRLISERTIEENILKKANQKRLLGDLAIEGGNFTTAYFKSSTIQDLFNVDQSESDASTRMAEVLDQSKDRERQREMSQAEDKLAIGALENALAAVEEDMDVQAAKTAKAEAVADLAEFDENIPVDDGDNEDGQISKAEMEVRNIVSQLTPVERYAMRFVEETDGNFSAAQLAAAERELEEQKKEWELDRLRAMREEEERQMRMTDDDENPLTFTREDSKNQVNNNSSNSRRVINKRPARLNNRRGRSRRVSVLNRKRGRNHRTNNIRGEEEEEQSTSDSESETTSMSDTDSQNEDINVVQEESSDDEAKSSHIDTEEEEGENENDDGYKVDKDEDDRPEDYKNSLIIRTKNHFDLNSPRTRSRGNVKINLWTLDVSPILPEAKPRNRSKKLKNNIDKDDIMRASDSVDSSDQQTAHDTSLNSSTEDSLCDEDDVDIKDSKPLSNVLDVKVTNITATRPAVKLNLKSYKKESEELKDDADDKTISPKTQEIQTNESRESISTPNKPGRPRKLQSVAGNTTSESNLNTTYSTRSGNKVQPIRLSQEKKLTALKINCKEELEICDINETKSERKKADRENECNSSIDKVARPNNVAINTEMHKEECSTVLERYDKSDNIEQHKQLKLTIAKCEILDTKLETAGEKGASSPTPATRKTKLTRSSARFPNGSKDNEIPEKKNFPSVSTEESSDSKMEIDVPLPAKNADDGSSSNKASTPNRCSPILITGYSKVTRLSTKSKLTVPENNESVKMLTETQVQERVKERPAVPETETKSKKCINLKVSEEKNQNRETPEVQETHKTLSATGNEENSDNLDMHTKEEILKKSSKSSNYECSVPVVKDLKSSSSSKSTEELKEQIILKIKRSSLRLANDKKPVESSNVSIKEASEKINSAPQEIVKVENSIFETTSKSAKACSIEKKSNEITEKEFQITKVPQSSVQVDNESCLTNIESLDTNNTNDQEIPIEKAALNDKELVSDNTLKKTGVEDKTKKELTAKVHEKNNSKSAAENEQGAAQTGNSILVNVSPSLSSEIKSDKSMDVDVSLSDTATSSPKPNSSTDGAAENVVSGSETHCTESKVESMSPDTEPVSVQSDNLPHEVDTTHSEQTQIAKFNMQQPISLPRRFQTPVKSTLRRRPDTPMPVPTSSRPVTRSLASNSGVVTSDDSGPSSPQNQQKLSPRSSKAQCDSGFLIPTTPPVSYRRSRSTTYVKMSDRISLEQKDPATPGSTAKARDGSTVNRTLVKKRPDTPMPSQEQVLRSRKTHEEFYKSPPKILPKASPPASSNLSAQASTKLSQQASSKSSPQASPETSSRTSPQVSPSVHNTQLISESHRNTESVTKTISDQSVKQQQSTNSEILIATDPNGNSVNSDIALSSHEKPQRTAKVVAILTLDSKNNGKNNMQQANSSTSPQKTRPLIPDSALPRPLRFVKQTSGIKISQDRSSCAPQEVTMVDLDDEPECNAESLDSTPRASKRIKRIRLANQLTKSSVSMKSPGKEIQTIEIEGEEADKIPLKKMNRCNPPPPALLVSGSIDKNHEPVS